MGMGLRLAVNLFSALPKNHCGMVNVSSDIWDNCVDSSSKFLKELVNIDSQHFQEPMDVSNDECSIESVRNVMLKHEKIFKEQVSELHRLYRAQKKIMAQLDTDFRQVHCPTNAASGAISDTKSGFWSSGSTTLTSRSPLHIDRPNNIFLVNSDCSFQHVLDTRAGPSSQGSSVFHGGTLKLQKETNLELCLHGDFALGAEAIVNKTTSIGRQLGGRFGLEREHSWADEDSDLELSLSIGCGANRKKSRQVRSGNNEGPSELNYEETRKPILPSLTRSQCDECSEMPPNFDTEKVQRSPWLFQTLSLNRT